MKELFLIRHAEAIPSDSSLPDFDRTLTKIGLQQANQIGNYLKDNRYLIDYFLTSPAFRTLETAYAIGDLISYHRENIISYPELYNAKLNSLLEILGQLDDTLQKIAIVSHNPGISMLANFLNKDINQSLPTCGLVILKFTNTQWLSCIAKHNSQLIKFIYPT